MLFALHFSNNVSVNDLVASNGSEECRRYISFWLFVFLFDGITFVLHSYSGGVAVVEEHEAEETKTSNENHEPVVKSTRPQGRYMLCTT